MPVAAVIAICHIATPPRGCIRPVKAIMVWVSSGDLGSSFGRGRVYFAKCSLYLLPLSVLSCAKLKGLGLCGVKGDNLETILSSAVRDPRLHSVMLAACVNLGQAA